MFSKPLLQVDIYDIINFRNKIHSWIYQIKTKNYSPETYFDRPALELAEAVRKSDLAVIRQQAPHLDLNHVYKESMTFLFYAMLCKQPKAVTELIKAGANPQQVREDFGSPLGLAASSNDSKYLAAMLDAGVSPNIVNSQGTPLLFETVIPVTMDNLKLLVERGANFNATTDSLGETAIYEALTYSNYDHVEYLIKKGARLDIPDANGVTFAYALERRFNGQAVDPTTPAFKKLAELKKLAEERGIKFPADPPDVVRAQMKAQGLKVVEPYQSKQEEPWSARIVDYGIYSVTQGKRIKDENVAGGLTVTSEKKLIKETDQIETSMGNSFGFRYILEGPDDSAYVTIKVKHPMLKDPETGKEFTTSEWGQRVPTHSVNWNTGWVFDRDRAMMPGDWIIQLFVDDAKLLEKKFTVVTRKDKFPKEFYEIPASVRNAATVVVAGKYMEGRSPCIPGGVEGIEGTREWYLLTGFSLTKIYRGDVGTDYLGIGQGFPPKAFVTAPLTVGNSYLVLLNPYSASQKWMKTKEGSRDFLDTLSAEEILAIQPLISVKIDDNPPAQNKSKKEESKYTSFTGTVKSLVPLPKFSGTYKPMELDPKYVIAVYVEETDQDFDSIPTGKILNIGIHSPSRLFLSSGKDIIGKKFKFHATWNAKEKKFELYGLSANEI